MKKLILLSSLLFTGCVDFKETHFGAVCGSETFRFKARPIHVFFESGGCIHYTTFEDSDQIKIKNVICGCSRLFTVGEDGSVKGLVK